LSILLKHLLKSISFSQYIVILILSMQEKRENTLIKFCFIIIHILLYPLLFSTQTYWITIPSIISLFLTCISLLRIHLKTKDKTFYILLSFPLLLCYFLLWLVETYIRMLAYILIIIFLSLLHSYQYAIFWEKIVRFWKIKRCYILSQYFYYLIFYFIILYPHM
jgi:hypothetical protein